MNDQNENPSTPPPDAPRPLSPQARRALAEAEARRDAKDEDGEARSTETGGPSGPEPTRYGDWEKGGIASDF